MNPDALYELFEKMCQNGKKPPPFPESLTYRQKQMQPTCATAGQMAWYINTLWDSFPGSFLNKWGFAKKEKARVLFPFGKENIAKADASLTQIVDLKLRKKEETLELAKMANDPIQYLECETVFLPLLEELGENDLIQQSRETRQKSWDGSFYASEYVSKWG